MAPERQDKDKYTHAEVGFEHTARGKNTCDECAHFIRGSLGGWHVGGCEIVKDPIEPEDWCDKFNAKGIADAPLLVRCENNEGNAFGLDCTEFGNAQLPRAEQFEQHGFKCVVHFVQFVDEQNALGSCIPGRAAMVPH
jgi:hypothetical protein